MRNEMLAALHRLNEKCKEINWTVDIDEEGVITLTPDFGPMVALITHSPASAYHYVEGFIAGQKRGLQRSKNWVVVEPQDYSRAYCAGFDSKEDAHCYLDDLESEGRGNYAYIVDLSR